MGRPIFGLVFVLATRTGVEALGINVFAAASARVEKGQNACARLGRSEKEKVKIANPATRSAHCSTIPYISGLVSCGSESGRCWFKSIGKQGFGGGSENTRMAYILSYISHSLNASVSVDAGSIAECGR